MLKEGRMAPVAACILSEYLMRISRIIAVHLFNDFSGSPLIFRQALEAVREEFPVVLFTTPGNNGFLSQLKGIQYKTLFYKRHQSRFLQAVFYFLSQCFLFLRLFFYLQKQDVVYVNTFLPFGALLAAWVKGCKLVYHIHETEIRPRLLKRVLTGIAERTASRIIFVSPFAASRFQFYRPAISIVQNALTRDFMESAGDIPWPNLSTPITVLMLCSLKVEKGVYEFLSVARQMPHYKFILVLNASDRAVERFKKKTDPPANCLLYSRQRVVLPFYERAHLVVNLSRPDLCAEAFGMTILEALWCGRPVIVPPVGGICELITNGVEGFYADSRNIAEVVMAIEKCLSEFPFYAQMAQAAHNKAETFNHNQFRQQVLEVFSLLINRDRYSIRWKNFPSGGKQHLN